MRKRGKKSRKKENKLKNPDWQSMQESGYINIFLAWVVKRAT